MAEAPTVHVLERSQVSACHDVAGWARCSSAMTILAVAAPTDTVRYSVQVATEGEQVRAAQRLRYDVFAGELDAMLRTAEPGLDIDPFDKYSDHLIIRDDVSGAVVGTYRMLPPHRAREAGRLYAEGEFDLSGLGVLRDSLVETGRSCVHPEHRSGAVINLMWAGITRYLHLAGYRWLAGCASIPLDDGGVTAAGVWNLVRERHLAPPAWRVRPHRPWLAEQVNVPGGRVSVPPLLRGYLRLGAWVCGPPAHDPDFATADLFTLLALDRMDPRYLQHFLGQ
jgi:putative hemolysin